MATVTVTPVAAGVYRVDDDGRQTIVYLAGTPGDWWAFSNGEVYRVRESSDTTRQASAPKLQRDYGLVAPMPATVVKLLVAPGQSVRKGETLLVLEAMKMELPIRAPADAVVRAVHCRQGELVQPDRALIELT